MAEEFLWGEGANGGKCLKLLINSPQIQKPLGKSPILKHTEQVSRHFLWSIAGTCHAVLVFQSFRCLGWSYCLEAAFLVF